MANTVEALQQRDEVAKTGVPGLDEIMLGGLPAGCMYLLQGAPGCGKTTMAIQFLMEGVRAKETVLYITLSESRAELGKVARSHGWSLDGIHLFELSSARRIWSAETRQTVFRSSDVELGETTNLFLDEIRRVNPTRLVFDSMSELRLLAGESWRYRLQILGLKQHFTEHSCTVLLLDDLTGDRTDLQLQSLVHGVINLEAEVPDYGSYTRRLRLQKMRGVPMIEGTHDIKITTGGVQVYPRLIAAMRPGGSGASELISSGVAGLDSMLGGGLHSGTSTLLMGPAGSGKSSIALRYAQHAAEQGVRSQVFIFEERTETILLRSTALGLDLAPHIESGMIQLRPVDPAELSAGEFAHGIREAVEQRGVRLLVIDSLTAYQNAMHGERALLLHLHELLTYLGQHGVTTLITFVQHGLFAPHVGTPVDVSYLADNVLLLRFYEYRGTIRKALSVFKRRTGGHESTIRDLHLGPNGIEIGPPLENFRGVLTGNPVFEANGHPTGAP